MRIQNPQRAMVIGLYLNAAVLSLILLTLLGRANLLPSAKASPAPQAPPIAGGGSIYLMPGQLAVNQWGCYIMDIDAQTLCAYEYQPGEKILKLVAARNFHFDRKLGNYNTTPPWPEIQKLSEIELQGIRANEAKPPAENPEGPTNNQ